MSIILPLSSLPAARLKEQADSGAFPWGDADAAQPIVEAACAQSDGDPEREAELIMLALRENVPAAIRRAIDRKPDSRMERCLAAVTDFYSQLPHIASRMSPQEARWSVDTLAAMANLIPISAVGNAETVSAAPPRQPPAPKSAPAPAAAPPASWAATQGAASAPPWAQGLLDGSAVPKVPVAMNATTSLPPPAGVGIAAGSGVPYDRLVGAAGQSWSPSPGSYGGSTLNPAAVPDEVANSRWSWAGFLSGVLWMCSHRLLYPALSWLALFIISFVAKPIGSTINLIGNLCLAIYLGINGNRLAWEHRRFESVQQFQTVQKIWLRVSLAFIILGILVGLIFGAVLFPVFLHAYNAARHSAPASP